MQEKLKRAVIREEYVLLTGNYISALILNQFVFWTERVRDSDRFVKEELVRLRREDKSANFPLRSGWIYKTASQLNDELMLGMSDATIHKYLSAIIKQGFLEQRNNPNHKWDRTLQYRVDMVRLQTELFKIGCPLDGWRILTDEIAFSDFENGDLKSENRNTKNSKALPETTTDNTLQKEDIAPNGAFSSPPPASSNGSQKPKNDYVSLESELIKAWGELFPDKRQPRTGTNRKAIQALCKKSPDFLESWHDAMSAAAQSPACHAESWFQFGFFVSSTGKRGNPDYLNYQKCLDRWMSWRDKDFKSNGFTAVLSDDEIAAENERMNAHLPPLGD